MNSVPRIVLMAALALGSAVPVMAGEAPAKRPCSNMSRACLIEVARSYLDARTDNRVRAGQRVSPHIKRWENGIMTAQAPDDILAPDGPGPSKLLAARELDRVLVDGDQAVFFWILDKRNKPEEPFSATVHIAERFKFVQGKSACGDTPSPCIGEIEVVMCTSPHPQESSAPTPKDPQWFSKFLCNREG